MLERDFQRTVEIAMLVVLEVCLTPGVLLPARQPRAPFVPRVVPVASRSFLRRSGATLSYDSAAERGPVLEEF